MNRTNRWCLSRRPGRASGKCIGRTGPFQRGIIPAMTKFLKEILAKLSELPPERQDELAAWLLAELEDEARWAKSFAESQDALARLANEALEEFRRGDAHPVNELTFGKKG